MKRVIRVGSVKKDFRQHFSKIAQREAGHQIYRLQEGFGTKDWKPLHGVGSGVREIRIHKERRIGIRNGKKGRRIFSKIWDFQRLRRNIS
ncbi:MAG: hypothetical protein D084_Lepto4C00186G0001 [Leptospirillum sp. Group IV 'UBA BS']|nr:MAG: hypothetical protein D084_Lepto4C00186G0001 [Leptospirillum sp. Group IV 'UBA BS']